MAFKTLWVVQALLVLSFISNPAGLVAQVSKANEVVSNGGAISAIVNHAAELAQHPAFRHAFVSFHSPTEA